jgi:predicted nicotinamide N-methyase
MDQDDHEISTLIPVFPAQESSTTTITQTSWNASERAFNTANTADEVLAPPTVSYTIPSDPNESTTTDSTEWSSATTMISKTIHLYGKKFRQVESESHDENHTGRTPTGLALWPAGKLVADFLACSSSTSSTADSTGIESSGADNAGTAGSATNNPQTVIELGCGLGLCGLVAYAIQQEQQASTNNDSTLEVNSQHDQQQQLVVLTDSDQETLQYARRNVERNHCAETDVVRLEILDWCSPEDIQRVKNLTIPSSLSSSSSSSSVDDDRGAGYDRVLASDVIYEATAPILKDFMNTAKSLLRKPAGLFVLGIRRRTTSLQEVRETAAAVGLEGGGFVSEFLLDIFDNRLEGDENIQPDNTVVGADKDGTTSRKSTQDNDCNAPNNENANGDTDGDEDDDGNSLFWAQAVLVFWHAGDEAGKELASTMCQQATKNAANGWLD